MNSLVTSIVRNTGGKDVSGAMTAAEALKAGGLDWRVEKKPVAFQTADSTDHAIADWSA